MLSDFFKLDGQTQKFDTPVQLVNHFKASDHIKNVLYYPELWPEETFKLSNKTFENVSLSKTRFSRVTFTKCTFTDCLLIGCIFENVDFHQCRFINCNFYKSRFVNCYLDPRSIELDKSYKKTHSNIGVSLFQNLLDNSSEQHQSDFAMLSDIAFRRWQRSQITKDVERHKFGKWTARWLFFKNAAYDALAGFGYRPMRFFIWTISIFVFFSILNHYFMWGELLSSTEHGPPKSFVDSVFYTFSILTVLGFSSITPVTPLAKILTVFEALAAIGWLGIFTSVLVKRFIR
jgi:hypothetical protein